MKKRQPKGISIPAEPRVVPLPLRMKILTGGVIQAVFIVMAALSFNAWTFQGFSDLTRSLVLQHCPTSSVPGHLLPDHANNTAYRVGPRRWHILVYRHTFEYVANGRALRGIGYSLSREELGRDATVNYSPQFPKCSRINGMRAMWDPIPMWFLIPGIALTLLLAIIMLRGRVRTIRTLRVGWLTRAWISKRNEYSSKGHTYITYEFGFKAGDGLCYTTEFTESASCSKALEDEAGEPLIYDPARPRTAFVLDSIPGRPRVDEKGVVRDSRPWTTPFLMITLVLAIVTLGLCVRSVVELLV